ncbi:uncharacterized protein K489DRAFT_63553 [Dissoconium aciculare CBS 342.82]|uniref:Uncharacterized protein n=1 Tax=Dissoconium aciculare CBS 342.82 TaxID=1314786 RepID=A0A6J3LXG7_9PEZI|nr:uncharacterized protein K489DRAFT_63553 [Dissoconium aciculare CBS 342.82]KAF1819989.1 hypothetical protein K489DRAFT_63553 [Dissoconium aciculare CBS 342.82]
MLVAAVAVTAYAVARQTPSTALCCVVLQPCWMVVFVSIILRACGGPGQTQPNHGCVCVCVCVCVCLGMSKLPMQRARRHTIILMSCCHFAAHVEKPNDERVCVHCCVLLVTISWRSATDTSLFSHLPPLWRRRGIFDRTRPSSWSISGRREKRPPLAHTRHPSTYTYTLSLSLANQKFTCSCFRLKRPIVVIITIPRLSLLSSSVPLVPSP